MLFRHIGKTSFSAVATGLPNAIWGFVRCVSLERLLSHSMCQMCKRNLPSVDYVRTDATFVLFRPYLHLALLHSRVGGALRRSPIWSCILFEFGSAPMRRLLFYTIQQFP